MKSRPARQRKSFVVTDIAGLIGAVVEFNPRFQIENSLVTATQILVALETQARAVGDAADQFGAGAFAVARYMNPGIHDAVDGDIRLRQCRRCKAGCNQACE